MKGAAGLVEKVVQQDGEYVAYGPRRSRRGYGSTPAQAVADLLRAYREDPVRHRPKRRPCT